MIGPSSSKRDVTTGVFTGTTQQQDPRPCCYVPDRKVNQHIGGENNVVQAAAELADKKTALALIV
jgi:hypothetical protein